MKYHFSIFEPFLFEAVEAIETTDIPRPGKSLLSTPESSRLLNLASF
jgi:hypothetical protein